MIPSINLGSDSLGLGQMFGGTASALTSATGTELCGSKPTCIGWTATCKEKNRVYNECRMRSLELMETQSNNAAQANAAQRSSDIDTAIRNERILYGVIALVIILLVVFIIKKMRA